MNCNEAVRWIMDKQNYTTTTLRIKLKIPSDKSNVLAGRINQENMSIAILSELVKAMGYMIVAMPDNVKVPNDAVILDYTETEAAAKRKAKTRERNKVQPTQSDTSESSKSDSSKSTPVSTPVSTPTTKDKADEDEPAKEQAPATLTSIEDVYVPTQEEIDEYNRIIEEYNKNRESRGLPKLDFNKHFDLDDFDDDPPVLPEPVDLKPYLISEDDDLELPL